MSEKLCQLKKKGGARGGGLPPMPTSESDAIIIQNVDHKWCGINPNTSIVHLKKNTGSSTSLNLQFYRLFSDGSTSLQSLGVTGTAWRTASVDMTDVVACLIGYSGSTSVTFNVYFS